MLAWTPYSTASRFPRERFDLKRSLETRSPFVGSFWKSLQHLYTTCFINIAPSSVMLPIRIPPTAVHSANIGIWTSREGPIQQARSQVYRCFGPSERFLSANTEKATRKVPWSALLKEAGPGFRRFYGQTFAPLPYVCFGSRRSPTSTRRCLVTTLSVDSHQFCPRSGANVFIRHVELQFNRTCSVQNNPALSLEVPQDCQSRRTGTPN